MVKGAIRKLHNADWVGLEWVRIVSARVIMQGATRVDGQHFTRTLSSGMMKVGILRTSMRVSG